MGKTYNALTGKELKTIAWKECEQLLETDPRFDREDPISKALLVFTLRIDHYPGGETPFEVRVSNFFKPPAGESLSPMLLKRLILGEIKRALDGDIRFSEHLTYPNVTFGKTPLIEIELTRPDGGTVGRTLVQAPAPIDAAHAVVDPRRIDLSTQSAGVPILAVADIAISDKERRLADLRQQIQDLEGPSAPVPVVMTSAEMHHRDYEPFTGTGLPLEAGFKPSPGPAMAGSFGGGAPVGAVQSQDVVEHIALGVTHADVDAGGLGAPDNVRREHGLFVPEQRAVGSQMVDIPAGSF